MADEKVAVLTAAGSGMGGAAARGGARAAPRRIGVIPRGGALVWSYGERIDATGRRAGSLIRLLGCGPPPNVVT